MALTTIVAGNPVPLILQAGDVILLTLAANSSGNVSVPGQAVSTGVTAGGAYPFGPYAAQREVIVTLTAGTATADFSGDASGGLTSSQVALTSEVAKQPGIPGTAVALSGDGYTGGATPWTRLAGPNELRTGNWSPSPELTTPSVAWAYTTAASASAGPCMFRREGASIRIDGSVVVGNTGAPNFCTLRNFAAAQMTGAQTLNTTFALVVYCHRLGGNGKVLLRMGSSSSNYVVYLWAQTAGMLVEGWNVLLASTAEVISTGSATNGQQDFQTGGVTKNGWTVGAGTYAFGTDVGYMAIEIQQITSNSTWWVEGLYYGGKDKPRLTIGFDIQGSGLDQAVTTMRQYGLVGYAATPTANGAPANPQYLWSSTDVARLQALYAAGWEVIGHSVSHNSFGTLTDDGMLAAEYEGCREQIRAIGCYSGADLYTSPNNSYSNRTIAVGARCGIRWMRHGINAPLLLSRGLVGLANPLVQGAITIANGDSQPNAAAEIARRLAFIDLMIQYGASGHIYTHSIIAGASTSTDTNATVFDGIMAGIAARVAAGTLSVVLPSAFLRESNTPNIDAVLAAPNRLPITAGASPFDLINTGYKPLRFAISGGTVSAISYSRDGTTFDAVGALAGQFDVNPGDRLRITYTVAPTIVQYSI
jgi:hypothetical protein